MDAVLNRLVTLKDSKRMSVRAFATFIGCNQVTIDRQLKGERQVSLDTVLCVLKAYPELSAEWLLRGDSLMLRVMNDSQTINVFSNSKVANNCSSIDSNNTAQDLASENDRLREEVRQLRERCDKLTDKLLAL